MSSFSGISSSLYTTVKKQSYILVAIGLIIIFFHPVIFLNKTFFFRDIHRWFYPMKHFLARSFQDGSIPLWCSNYFCGSPFISDLQAGVFYPLSLIFLLEPIDKIFNIYILIHFFLGFIFLYLFIKEIGLSPKTAIFVSIAYCFGGYVLSSVNTLNNLSTLIWLPAILWAMTRAITKRKISGYFLSIFFSCMSILGGEPQLFLMSIVLLFFYCLICIPHQNPGKYSIKIPILIFIMIASAVLITFIQLGPAYMDYRLSVRLGGMSYMDATKHSLSPEVLKHLFLPLRFASDFTSSPGSLKSVFETVKVIPWLLTIYPGLMILPFAFFGVVFNYSQKTLFWLFIFISSLTLAMGNHTPVYYILYKIIPIFRYPEKFMFLASFSLIIMAAYGFDKFLQLLRKKATLSFIFYVLTIILIFDLYYNHRNLNPYVDSGIYQTYHPDLKPVIEDEGIFRIYVDQDRISMDSSQDSILEHHLMWQTMIFPNLGVLKNIDQINGTTGLELRYQYIITEILQKPWEDKIDFLKMANVKYIISSQNLNKIPALKDKIEMINPHAYLIKEFLPRAWIAGELHPIKKGTLDELLKPDFDYRRSAITNDNITHKYKTPYFEKVNQISYKSSNRIEIDVDAKKPGFLILSESSYPGWKVFVDGDEKRCLWLNLLFQGVEIDKGKHKIIFIYFPKYFGIYASISLASIVLFSLIWLYCLFSAKKDLKINKQFIQEKRS